MKVTIEYFDATIMLNFEDDVETSLNLNTEPQLVTKRGELTPIVSKLTFADFKVRGRLKDS